MRHPTTPFSTPLSGSAKETQLRIRSIFHWKKQRPPVFLLLLVLILALGCGGLVSCQQEEPAPVPVPTPQVPEPEPQQPAETDPPEDSVDPSAVFQHYWDQFPQYQYTGETRFDFDGRTLTLGDPPENMAEDVVWNHWYYEMSGRFDALESLAGGASLKLSARNTAKHAAEGIAFQSVTIHALDAISSQDFSDTGPYFSPQDPGEFYVQELADKAGMYGLTEYALVYTDVSWTWTPEALALGPQLGDGDYERVYLVGSTGPDQLWKVYEVYWVYWLQPDHSAPEQSEEDVGEDGPEDRLYALTDLLSSDPMKSASVLASLQTGGKTIGLDSRHLAADSSFLADILGLFSGTALRPGGEINIPNDTYMTFAFYDPEGRQTFSISMSDADSKLYIEDSLARTVETYSTPYDLLAEHLADRIRRAGTEREMTLRMDGSSAHVGMGSDPSATCLSTIPMEEDWRIVYDTGDSWRALLGENISLLCYYSAERDTLSLNNLETTRTDLTTWRGIRVGSTRSEVLALYPGIFTPSTPYWQDTGPDFPSSDYLWYCDNREGWGSSLLFFFENDAVSEIWLKNMTD